MVQKEELSQCLALIAECKMENFLLRILKKLLVTKGFNSGKKYEY